MASSQITPDSFMQAKQPGLTPDDFMKDKTGFGFPKGHQPATLPNVTNDDIKSAGTTALHYLPAALATGAAMFQPELLPVAGGFWSTAAAATGLAAAGGAAGSAIEQGVESATGMEDRPRGVGEFGLRLGKEAVKQGAMEFGGRLVAKPFEFIAGKFTPGHLMQSAIKPSTSLEVAKRDQILGTALREGVPASEGGYHKLRAAITDLTGQIDAKIAAKSPDLGAVINPKTVASRLDALIDFYEKQAAPAEDLAAIKGVREQFLKRHSYDAPFTKIRLGTDDAAGGFVPTGEGKTRIYQDMTLSEAQAEKRGTQRFNAEKLGDRGTARDEAEKSLAYSLKEQISALFPEVQGLNARDSEMLALEEQLRRFVGREGNKNRIGLIPTVAAAGTGLFGAASGNRTEEGIGAGGLLTMSILALDNPEIKSRLAIALAKAAKSRIGAGVHLVGSRLGKELPAAAGRALTPAQ